VLLVLGFIYSGGISRGWPDVRLLGVLPRIALAYAGGALLFCFLPPRRLAAAGVALLAVYWALLTFVPVRDIALDKDAIAARLGAPKPPLAQVRQLFDQTTTWVTGRYEPGLNLTNHLDFVYLPGAKYDVYWDPEGLLSTLPAIASCLLGVLAGGWMRRSDYSARHKLLRLVAGGAICLALGWLWSVEFPVVKKIWTSSFVLVAGGWSMLLLAAFYYVIDVRGWQRWCTPFVWIGLNPITLYLASNFVGFRSLAARFVGGDVKRLLDTSVTRGTGDLLIVLVGLGLMFVLARFLHQRRIYLRA
jgi:predicted acyltransferase